MSGRGTLVIASNLHVGGGVQVAASLINEWAMQGGMGDPGVQLEIEVSPAVWDNLNETARSTFEFIVRRRRPYSIWHWPGDLMRRYDRVLVVFGPTYFPYLSRRTVGGYADVTSLYATSEYLSPTLPVRRTLRARVRKAWSLRWARRLDGLIVETDAIRHRLRQALGNEAPEIEVIPNSVSSSVARSDAVYPLPRRSGEALLAYPARAYPHKNLEFLPRVARSVRALRPDLSVRFVVTLTDREWRARSADFRAACLNVGELRVEEVGAVMRASDAVFFPSLLEAQSATPLEALAVGTPLLASDRDFVRSTCGEAAMYFDPRDPLSAARVIVRALGDTVETARLRRHGLEVVDALPSPSQRAARTWAFTAAHKVGAGTSELE